MFTRQTPYYCYLKQSIKVFVDSEIDDWVQQKMISRLVALRIVSDYSDTCRPLSRTSRAEVGCDPCLQSWECERMENKPTTHSFFTSPDLQVCLL
jgi:hypothetical protein